MAEPRVTGRSEGRRRADAVTTKPLERCRGLVVEQGSISCICTHGSDGICGLQADEASAPFVFVFGSNLAGRHGKGSAKEALRTFGAIYGQGIGRQGRSYAIPTKDERLRTLPLDTVKRYIAEFLAYAVQHADERFHVVKIGCGLAGFREDQIAPLFRAASANVELPDGWSSVAGTQT